MVACPICDKPVKEPDINRHIDSNCRKFLEDASPPPPPPTTHANGTKPKASTFFTPAAKRPVSFRDEVYEPVSSPIVQRQYASTQQPALDPPLPTAPIPPNGVKRPLEQEDDDIPDHDTTTERVLPPPKKHKNAHAPLADRMRPQTLDEVAGQALVGTHGVLRNLILSDRVPSMILWGGPGTGKTTIARLIARTAGTRFVEINSTSSGVAECKKIFAEAKNELGLTGRKTILFCDEIHRFSKSQQDVFLGPVEAGMVTLIGATTENPSFKVVNALLSRCRTFTLSKLGEDDLMRILRRALAQELPELPTPMHSPTDEDQNDETNSTASQSSHHLLTDNDLALIRYLAAFADGDARTALNLLELALDLCRRPGVTTDDIKKSLTQTLVYDRAGDQHYDTISAFRTYDLEAFSLASDDVGLADNSLLSLATATYTAAQTIGMPECRINLGHCAVALSLAPKSTRAYLGLKAAYSALSEPGVAGLPVPVHLRNAPTKLMNELGYGKEYKYNPDYEDGRVVQDYLPEKLIGRKFLGSKDLGDEVDPEVVELDEQLRAAATYEPDEEVPLLNPDGD
ncbi:hypothetical protein LTR62_001263 [Meristemomyces frigidus]|uniref:UBZ4-type domain-containing protein n=1 Tax=Meristemomyces frigidus TaxID=1508187 RepID=A0AAN7YMI2_9PEZI|nr:hypothetical protein LTR62_001263 [Meristemomyces frigidus]